ncbi:venom protein 29-like [Centruroides vittatus]|uniref:venom protein 29-like n=1 Tax=Centruroides vittatus TaxID=120091 RepID=UPI00350FAC7E
MKTFVIFSFLAVFVGVRAFTGVEFMEIGCSVPEKYMVRFIECTFNRSSQFFQKGADVVHECVIKWHESKSKWQSVLMYNCMNGIHESPDLWACTQEKQRNVRPLLPPQKDMDDLIEHAKYCMIHA